MLVDPNTALRCRFTVAGAAGRFRRRARSRCRPVTEATTRTSQHRQHAPRPTRGSPDQGTRTTASSSSRKPAACSASAPTRRDKQGRNRPARPPSHRCRAPSTTTPHPPAPPPGERSHAAKEHWQRQSATAPHTRDATKTTLEITRPRHSPRPPSATSRAAPIGLEIRAGRGERRTTAPRTPLDDVPPTRQNDAPMSCQGSISRRCWQTSDGPLEVRGQALYQARRCRDRAWWSGGPADRSQDNLVGRAGISGARPATPDRGARRRGGGDTPGGRRSA